MKNADFNLEQKDINIPYTECNSLETLESLSQTRFIIVSVLIAGVLIYSNIVTSTFAQFPGTPTIDPPGPCPGGLIPETDSFGQIILDPVTGDPNCIAGPP